MIDLRKIKPGDEVTVRCVVTNVGSAGTIGCKTDDSQPEGFRADPECIVSHTPKALAVGDRVKDVDGDIWEVATQARRYGSTEEYALWSDQYGFAGRSAEQVREWERVS